MTSATAIRVSNAPTVLNLQGTGTTRSDALNRLVVWLLLAFAFVLPTDIRLPGYHSIAMRLGYASLLLGIAGLIKRRAFVLPHTAFWSLFGFVAWSLCSLSWSRFPEIAHHKALLYIVLFTINAIIPQYAWDARVRIRLIDAYLAGCYLGIMGTAVNLSLGIPYAPPDDIEMEGRYSFSTDPNYLALALVIGVPLALYRSGIVLERWKRTIFLIYVPAAVTGVYLTGSRGALLALFVAIIVYALFTGLRAPALMLAGATLCLGIGALLPGRISGRFVDIPDELRYGTLSDRRELWNRGTALVAEHPLEGIGAGATAGAFDIAAHNTPLELMMEGGAVSVSLFYGALMLGIWGGWKTDRKESRPMIAAWSAWLAGTFSLSWEIQTITWFLFALLFSAASPRGFYIPVQGGSDKRDRYSFSESGNGVLPT